MATGPSRSGPWRAALPRCASAELRCRPPKGGRSVKREAGEEDRAGGAGIGGMVNAGADRFTIPRQADGLIRRSRLLEDLELGVAGPLTLVSAPAGTGKTVLVSTWARRAQARGPVGWVTLEANDASRPAFWSSFSLALQRCGVDIPLP